MDCSSYLQCAVLIYWFHRRLVASLISSKESIIAIIDQFFRYFEMKIFVLALSLNIKYVNMKSEGTQQDIALILKCQHRPRKEILKWSQVIPILSWTMWFILRKLLLYLVNYSLGKNLTCVAVAPVTTIPVSWNRKKIIVCLSKQVIYKILSYFCSQVF